MNVINTDIFNSERVGSIFEKKEILNKFYFMKFMYCPRYIFYANKKIYNHILQNSFTCEICDLKTDINHEHCCAKNCLWNNAHQNHCSKCHFVYGKEFNHCCQCQKVYDSKYYTHCSTCCTHYNIEKKHCCQCQKVYDSKYYTHCSTCCTHYNIEKKHCCDCKKVYDSASETHCSSCCITFAKNMKHCCNCKKVYNPIYQKHCCNCCVTIMEKYEDHCCKCQKSYEKKHMYHCDTCCMIVSKHMIHCCICKKDFSLSSNHCSTCHRNINHDDEYYAKHDCIYHCCCCGNDTHEPCKCPPFVNLVMKKAAEHCSQFLKNRTYKFYPNKYISQNCAAWKKFSNTINRIKKKPQANNIMEYIESSLHSEKEFCFAFHGTSSTAGESICNIGFDPSKRGTNGQYYGTGEYFAKESYTPIRYLKEDNKNRRGYLVITLIMHSSHITYRRANNGDQWYIIDSNESDAFYMPLALVSFNNWDEPKWPK
jgi:Poly(ADP-ribose) polymerase catalytic domain